MNCTILGDLKMLVTIVCFFPSSVNFLFFPQLSGRKKAPLNFYTLWKPNAKHGNIPPDFFPGMLLPKDNEFIPFIT